MLPPNDGGSTSPQESVQEIVVRVSQMPLNTPEARQKYIDEATDLAKGGRSSEPEVEQVYAKLEDSYPLDQVDELRFTLFEEMAGLAEEIDKKDLPEVTKDMDLTQLRFLRKVAKMIKMDKIAGEEETDPAMSQFLKATDKLLSEADIAEYDRQRVGGEASVPEPARREEAEPASPVDKPVVQEGLRETAAELIKRQLEENSTISKVPIDITKDLLTEFLNDMPLGDGLRFQDPKVSIHNNYSEGFPAAEIKGKIEINNEEYDLSIIIENTGSEKARFRTGWRAEAGDENGELADRKNQELPSHLRNAFVEASGPNWNPDSLYIKDGKIVVVFKNNQPVEKVETEETFNPLREPQATPAESLSVTTSELSDDERRVQEAHSRLKPPFFDNRIEAVLSEVSGQKPADGLTPEQKEGIKLLLKDLEGLEGRLENLKTEEKAIEELEHLKTYEKAIEEIEDRLLSLASGLRSEFKPVRIASAPVIQSPPDISEAQADVPGSAPEDTVGSDQRLIMESAEALSAHPEQAEKLIPGIRELLERDPENSGARQLLGDVYMRSGKFQKAIDEYNKVLESRRQPEPAEAEPVLPAAQQPAEKADFTDLGATVELGTESAKAEETKEVDRVRLERYLERRGLAGMPMNEHEREEVALQMRYERFRAEEYLVEHGFEQPIKELIAKAKSITPESSVDELNALQEEAGQRLIWDRGITITEVGPELIDVIQERVGKFPVLMASFEGGDFPLGARVQLDIEESTALYDGSSATYDRLEGWEGYLKEINRFSGDDRQSIYRDRIREALKSGINNTAWGGWGDPQTISAYDFDHALNAALGEKGGERDKIEDQMVGFVRQRDLTNEMGLSATGKMYLSDWRNYVKNYDERKTAERNAPPVAAESVLPKPVSEKTPPPADQQLPTVSEAQVDLPGSPVEYKVKPAVEKAVRAIEDIYRNHPNQAGQIIPRLEEVIAKDPNYAEGYRLLAELYDKNGQPEKALEQTNLYLSKQRTSGGL